MAQMVPRQFDPSTTTHSEQEVFVALSRLPDSVVVLHRLLLPRHVAQKQGEADFIVISPRGVLCLEVKGGQIAQRAGEWFFGDDPVPRQSPFAQATDNMHSLISLLDRRRNRPGTDLPRPLVGCGVLLPHVEFVLDGDTGDASIVPEIVLDRRRGLGDLAAFLDECHDYWQQRVSGRARYDQRLTRADVHALKQALRGDFELLPPAAVWHERVELLLKAEEEDERLRYFDTVESVPRILLCGVAGSGKTALALEYARRQAIAGKEVLFLCFNKNLRGFLEAQLDARVMAWTFHDYLTTELPGDLLPPMPAEDKPKNAYYQVELPRAYCSYARSTGRQALWDCLIVDEGQDLLLPAYLECMDLMIRGGLRGGCWQIAYDANQDIYNRSSEDTLAALLRDTWAMRYPLRHNHRNTMAIALFNEAFTGLDCGRPRLPLLHPRVTACAYGSQDEELSLVADAVRSLVGQGVPRREIVLLGRHRMANSCLRGNPAALGPDLPVLELGSELSLDKLKQDAVKYCTIWGYKGIDAPFVLLLDLDGVTFRDKQLCHTAISRARTGLTVFYDGGLGAAMQDVIARYHALLAAAP